MVLQTQTENFMVTVCQQRTSKRSSDSPNISANGVGSMTVDTSSIDEGGMYLLHVQTWRQAQGGNLKPNSAFCKQELSEPRDSAKPCAATHQHSLVAALGTASTHCAVSR